MAGLGDGPLKPGIALEGVRETRPEPPPSDPAAASSEAEIGFGGLSPEEWLVLFPRPVQATRDVGDTRSPPADPASNLRQKDPLTMDSVLRTLAVEPLLQGLVRMNLALGPLASKSVLRVGGYNLLICGTMGFLWGVNDGRLGTKQLAAGELLVLPRGLRSECPVRAATASAVLRVLVYGVAFRWVAVWANTSNYRAASSAGIHQTPDLSFWPGASLWRYIQLSSGRGRDLEDIAVPGSRQTQLCSSTLLVHSEEDELCSCPSLLCAGNLPAQCARIQTLLLAVALSVALFHDFAGEYTLLVTFASSLWASWWGVLLGIVVILATLFDVLPNYLGGPIMANNFSVCSLERRLLHRAVSSALRLLVVHFDGMLARGKEDSLLDARAEELYGELLPAIFTKWRANYLFRVSVWLTLAIFVCESICIVVSVALGSCIPTVTIALVAAGFYLLILELVNTSILNNQANDVSELCVSAARSLKKLIVAAERDPALRTTNVIGRIASHIAMLQSYADTDAYKSRLFGVQVTMGFVRTLVVTSLTVCLGLWTILRGSGVFVTIETVCPITN
ncbi:hypothetical protein DFJ74DRAFT_687365 [Hyaloraphidium curvatum]|nr:hypothetical protein DFJ74DRAFT_687365 [Hyaloraphidium curvatum]